MDPTVERAFPFRQYAEILFKRRWIVASVAAVVLTVVTLGSFLMTPVYLATTTIQIEKGVPRILPFEEIGSMDYPGGANAEFYQTQYRLLQSRTVARRASLALNLRNDPEVRMVVRDKAEPAADPEKPYIDYVLEHLEIEPLRNTHIVEIQFPSHSPGLSARVANATADAYMAFISEAKSRTTSEAGGLIGTQIQSLKEEIARLEDELGKVGRETEIISLDDRDDITAQKLAMLTSDCVAAQVERSRKEARYRGLLKTAPEAFPEVASNPTIQRLKQQAADLEREVAQKSRSFKADWPEMRRLRAERDSTVQRIKEERETVARAAIGAAEADYMQALQHETTVERALEKQKEEAMGRKKRSARYSNLQAAVTSKRNLLATLLQREGETRSLSGLEDDLRSNVWVVDRAEPPEKPYSPNVLLNVLLALVSGISLGVLMAVFIEHLDNTIKTTEDAARCAPVPVLASVPDATQGSRRLRPVGGGTAAPAEASPSLDLITCREPRSPAAEAYRDLRTALLFSAADHPPRHLVVSSTQPLEGKSTTSLNLAVSLAQLGRRVLLVDTDLRRPRLHKVFGFSASPGISNYLSGNAQLEGLVQETEIPNLFFLASGPLPPNPAELLDSKRFDELRDHLTREARFEHVIYDSSPILSVADPTILASRTEATLLVVRAGLASRETVQKGFEKLRQVNARVVGIVVNGVERARWDYYYRYRYYDAHDEADAKPAAPTEGRALGDQA